MSDRLSQRVIIALEGLLDSARAVAGGRCAICRLWCTGALCSCCRQHFSPSGQRCEGCALPLAHDGQAEPRCSPCRRDPPPWSRLVAGTDYGYPWDGLMAGFKFGRRTELVHALLVPLRARLREATRSARPAVLRIVPVPLAPERLRERGFNQAWELARRLAREPGREARADALFRVRDTGHQLGLRRAARRANLRDAFVVAPHRAAWVRDASIALVDDVLTTGATARAAVQALRAAGAREVQVWVAARVAGDRQ